MNKKQKDIENESNDKKKTIKIILLGNTETGKTSLINAYEGKKFLEESLSTFGSQFIRKDLEINGEIYSVQIWDTAGQERYRSVNKIYIKGSHIVLFVYDVTNRLSFTDLADFWVDYVDKILGNNITRGLAGNKIDLQDIKVSKKEGKEYAEKICALFQQTSAKDHPQGIIDFIYELCTDYVSKYGEQLQDEGTFNIRKQGRKKNQGKGGEKGVKGETNGCC